MDMDAVIERLKKCEEDIKILYNKVNKSEVREKEIATKLDNVLLELGRVRESVDDLKARPGTFWNKFLYAIIGAGATALVTYLITGGI